MADGNGEIVVKRSTLVFLISLFGIVTTLLGFTYNNFFLDRDEIEFVRSLKKYQSVTSHDIVWRTNITRDIQEIRDQQQALRKQIEQWKEDGRVQGPEEKRQLVIDIINELKRQGKL